MMGLAVVAEPLVRIMLTRKHSSFCRYFVHECISPIQVVNLQVINAIGEVILPKDWCC